MNVLEELQEFINEENSRKNNKERNKNYKYIKFLMKLNNDELINSQYDKNMENKNNFKIKKVLTIIKRNKNQYNKEELKDYLKEVNYFRVNKSTLKELSINDKKELKKLEIFSSNNFNYYKITDYIYEKLLRKIESKKLLKNIIYYYMAHKRKKIVLNKKKNIKVKRTKDSINSYLEILNESKKENEILKNTYKYVKKIERELNNILSYKINISYKSKTVSIFDKKSNSFLIFDISLETKLEHNSAGMCDYNKKIIFLSLEEEIKDSIVVFFHELGHMYDYFINYVIKKNCKVIKSLRDDLSNIDAENVSMFFEIFAESILSKYTKEYKYDTFIKINKLVFKYINKIDESIVLNNIAEEIYFYDYYLFRKSYKYKLEEINQEKDIYVYGYEKGIELYNKIS